MKSHVYNYGVALLAVTLAVGVRWLLDPLLGDQFPYGTLSLAFVFSVWYCGQGPGLMSLVLALLIGTYFFVAPRGFQAILEPTNAIGCLIYLMVGLCLLAFARSLRAAHHRLEEAIDERRRKDAELRDSRNLFESFMDHVPVTAFMKDDQGKYVFINSELERISERSRGAWVGKTDWEIFDHETASRLRSDDAVVMTADEPRAFEMEQTTFGDERKFFWSVVKFPYRNLEGRRFLAGLAMNITNSKLAEHKLRDSEERFRAIFSQANVGIVECDVDGRFIRANDKFLEILGYPREELLQLRYQDVTHPGDLAACNALVAEAMQHEQSFTTEKRYVRKDGRAVWVSTAVSVVRDEAQQPDFAVVIVEDISARKEAEEIIKAERTMLRQLYDSTENERKLVSFELHDGPIQYATAALMHLEAYRASISDNPPELELTRHLIDKTLLESRRLMNGLRPPVLDHSGLVAGISQLILSEFGDTLDVEFEHGPDLGRYAPSLESAIYRIVQEGLTNVRKHSGTDKVRIVLNQFDDHLRLEIEDWGKGFDVREKGEHRGGLKGFAERVRLAGGKLTIDSMPGRGTRILVELPLILPVKATGMEEIHA